jgi:hypothetical protein
MENVTAGNQNYQGDETSALVNPDRCHFLDLPEELHHEIVSIFWEQKVIWHQQDGISHAINFPALIALRLCVPRQSLTVAEGSL